jgi:hypothetical protein
MASILRRVASEVQASSCRRCRALVVGILVPLLVPLLVASVATAAEDPFAARVSEAKIVLRPVHEPAEASPAALCSVRMVEDSAQLALLCRHELGTDGELSLVRAGFPIPLWSAPLTSPFEIVAELSEEALAALVAGELAIRIDTGAAGIVVEGAIDAPIFDSGFDFFSLCEWSNYPCPSDGNVCTYDQCSSTGVCSYINHSVACSPANATGLCNNGICQITACNGGYSNCNITSADGCEVNHNPSPACTTFIDGNTWVGSYAGDTVCGSVCPLNYGNGHNFATRTGRSEAVYIAEALEVSSCLGNLEHAIELQVPDGIDYDLYVYRNCALVGYSNLSAGKDEYVVISTDDFPGGDQDFYYQVEVRWYSGSSCQDWTLKFWGYTC